MKVQLLKSAAQAGFGLAMLGVSFAQAQVDISTKSGIQMLRGDIVSFDEQWLVMRSSLGLVRILRAQVNCKGATCPADGAAQVAAPISLDRLTISGMEDAGGELLMQLVSGYITGLGGQISANVDQAERAIIISGKGNDGSDLFKAALRRRDSTGALEDLLSGDAQIAVTTRLPTDEERFLFAVAGLSDAISGASESVLALEGAIVITGEENPLRSLSVDDAAAVFSGQITNWSAFGGPDAPIRVITAGLQRPSGSVFAQKVLEPRGVSFAPSAETALSEDNVADAVANDPNAIGLVGLREDDNTRALPLRLECGLVADATNFSMKSEEYPLMRRLYVYSRRSGVDTGAQDILDYARSQEGQLGMANAGYINQGLSQRRMNEYGTRLAGSLFDADDPQALELLRILATELIDADQFSSTMRFRPGAAVPDSRAEDDIQRLANLFQAPQFREREIVLVGFTDNVGLLNTNVTLSQRRASRIRDDIIAASQGRLNESRFRILGLGPTAPVGCNDNEAGREANRRVEIWLRNKDG